MVKHVLDLENCYKNKNHTAFQTTDTLIFHNGRVNILNVISVFQSIFLTVILPNPIQPLYTGCRVTITLFPSTPCLCVWP